MMLYIKFLQIYILISTSIIVKSFRWFLMIQLLSRHMSFDGGHVPSVYCASKGMVTVMLWDVNQLMSFKGFLNHQSLGYCMWCKCKSYNRGYVQFCVPWILEVFTNDPCAGTTNDCICCLHQLSIHVGIHCICRP